MPTTTWSPVFEIAQAAAERRVRRRRRSWRPCAGSCASSHVAMVADQGLADWWWSRNLPARSNRVRRQPVSASPESTGEQPRPSNWLSIFSIVGAARGFDLAGAGAKVAVGAADRELLHFKAAAEFDNRVEDPLHEVRIDQVALGLDDFGRRGRPCDVACRSAMAAEGTKRASETAAVLLCWCK